jgi:hypothetical protein
VNGVADPVLDRADDVAELLASKSPSRSPRPSAR